MSTTVGEAAADREAVFDSVIGPLIDPAFKLAVVFLHDAHEAEDAVQEATVKAWRNLDRLRGQSAARSWFLAIVANQCRSMRRSRWFSVLRTDLVQRYEIAEPSEARLDLAREMARLPETDRAALFLFFYLDLPMGEVARVLKISPQAAKSRVHRAVLRLRLQMEEVAE